jgi:hypothetical protein
MGNKRYLVLSLYDDSDPEDYGGSPQVETSNLMEATEFADYLVEEFKTQRQASAFAKAFDKIIQ